tara:strand:+ start:115 stop:321 length:207 start_codon:yes stop_codon:yes gene_type:complete
LVEAVVETVLLQVQVKMEGQVEVVVEDLLLLYQQVLVILLLQLLHREIQVDLEEVKVQIKDLAVVVEL